MVHFARSIHHSAPFYLYFIPNCSNMLWWFSEIYINFWLFSNKICSHNTISKQYSACTCGQKHQNLYKPTYATVKMEHTSLYLGWLFRYKHRIIVYVITYPVYGVMVAVLLFVSRMDCTWYCTCNWSNRDWLYYQGVYFLMLGIDGINYICLHGWCRHDTLDMVAIVSI